MCFDAGLRHAYRGGVPERRGCAGGCVCEWPQTNLSLKFNFYFIFRGKIFEQKLDIAFIMF